VGIKIQYENKKIEKVLNVSNLLVRTFGPINARKIVRRLNEISASDSLGMMLVQRIGRCHPLSGDRAGQYAFDVEQPLRLIVVPVYDSPAAEEAKDLYSVTTIKVVEVTDYHG